MDFIFDLVFLKLDYAFSIQPTDKVVIGGVVDVYMRCEAEAMPGFTWKYSWLQGNQPVHNNSQIRLHLNHQSGSLNIRLRANDRSFFSQGEVNSYRCIASNANGSIISKTARLVSGSKCIYILITSRF